MKKKNLTLAILAMAVATVVSVAIVSCKKESTNELLTSGSQAVEAFAIDYPYATYEHPAIWSVGSNNGHFSDHWWSYYHDLTVIYAQYNVIPGGGSTND